ncbi:hypothetical protein CR513_09854, partial [Mucuna pruriens]
MANPNQKDWSQLLEDALLAYRTAYRILLVMSPYWIIFDKAYHLPELEELLLEAYENSWIYKQKVKQFHDSQILRKEFQVDQKVLLFNSRLKLIAVELKDEAINNTFHVNRHQLKTFHEVLTPIKRVQSQLEGALFNSRLKLIAGKLRFRWDGPFVITNIFPYGVVELRDEASNKIFQVNRNQLKHFHEGPTQLLGEVESISLRETDPPRDAP